jgi:hypothetical protein
MANTKKAKKSAKKPKPAKAGLTAAGARKVLRERVEADGIGKVATAIGVQTNTVRRFLGGQPNHPGTKALVMAYCEQWHGKTAALKAIRA